MIFTGYFEKLEEYKKRGLTPICIAGYAPQGYSGAYYKSLAPKKVWWQEWHDKGLSTDWYEMKYHETVLSQLNPQQVALDMQAVANNVVLLCYEKPTEFCHRHLVARWLNSHHIPVREVELTQTHLR